MAKKAIHFSQITSEVMNRPQSYRVKFSYGTFSVMFTRIGHQTYCYTYKRHKRKTYKVYVGKTENVTKEMLHTATMALLAKMPNGCTTSTQENRSKGPTIRQKIMDRASIALSANNAKALLYPQGETVTIHNEVFTLLHTRVEQGTNAMVALIENACQQLGQDALDYYLAQTEEQYNRMEKEIIRKANQ